MQKKWKEMSAEDFAARARRIYAQDEAPPKPAKRMYGSISTHDYDGNETIVVDRNFFSRDGKTYPAILIDGPIELTVRIPVNQRDFDLGLNRDTRPEKRHVEKVLVRFEDPKTRLPFFAEQIAMPLEHCTGPEQYARKNFTSPCKPVAIGQWKEPKRPKVQFTFAEA